MAIFGGSTRATGTSMLTALVLLAATPAFARVGLPDIFADNMVLQSDMAIPVWGWGTAEEEITVTLGSHRKTATADAKGKWLVRLPVMKPGGPYKLTVTGENTITLKNILVGEVWLCCGQEGMASPLYRAPDGRKEAAVAKYEKIRLCRINRRSSGLPVRNVKAEWVSCEPKAASPFSAIAYYFARDLHKELNVPVGLISACWHGARIESLTPAAAFLAAPKFQQLFVDILKANKKYDAAVAKALPEIETWVKAANKARKEGRPVPVMPEIPRHEYDSSWRPTSIYNGMLHPVAGLAMRGVIFYQGTANKYDGMLYHDKMKALITGWRKAWGRAVGAKEGSDFAFYFVQLTPQHDKRRPAAIPQFWEAQRAALELLNTGMVVTTDLVDKRTAYRVAQPRELGRRLSLWALARNYGRKGLAYCGPLYKGMEVRNGKIRISFDHVGGGLVSRGAGGRPANFQIAGADKKFVKADARIDGRTVVVSGDAVEEPVTVRFGWDPATPPDLFNKEGLPACPFTTDK